MDNPETLATSDTQDTGRRQTKQQKAKNINSTNPGAREKEAFPASYKTPAMLIISSSRA